MRVYGPKDFWHVLANNHEPGADIFQMLKQKYKIKKIKNTCSGVLNSDSDLQPKEERGVLLLNPKVQLVERTVGRLGRVCRRACKGTWEGALGLT